MLSWNCNMAFRNKTKILDEFNPDIAVIQECESREVLKNKKANIGIDKYIWIGKNKNKGLGVMAFHGFDIELLTHNPEFEYVLPIKIHKDQTEFFLLAIWTQLVNKDIYESYVVQATRAFIYYKGLLRKENIIIAGDFNSNAIWDNESPKEFNHTAMIKILQKHKIVSVYHEKNLEEQGKEKIPTLYLTHDIQKPFHIDYVFIKKKLLESVSFFYIGEYSEYIKQSDHMPLFVEII